MKSPRSSRRALEALGSPARQELITALAGEPLTVRELGQRLGRSRQALYYHLGALERAGLVAVKGHVGEGRSRERRYGVVSREMILGARRNDEEELEHAVQAAHAMLRLTSREMAAAVRESPKRRPRPERELMALRGKAWLTAAELKRLNQLLDQAYRVVAGGTKPRGDGRLYALTVVLTPVKPAGQN
ncbi:MAG: winged helix-turn-helix domain-containing protein [Gemmatimonadales bacterium]